MKTLHSLKRIEVVGLSDDEKQVIASFRTRFSSVTNIFWNRGAHTFDYQEFQTRYPFILNDWRYAITERPDAVFSWDMVTIE